MRISKNLSLFRYSGPQNKGSLLIITLWMLIIFSIFAVGLYRIVSSQVNLARRLEGLTLSSHVVGGFCKFIQGELERDGDSSDSLYELGSPKEVDFGFVHLEYSLIDEESKININKMPTKFIKELPGLDEDTAVNIRQSVLRPFHLKEELLLVEGVDQESYIEFSPFITVQSKGRININTVSEEILTSLGFDDDLVRIILSFRKGEDDLAGTEDDGVFKSQSAIVDTLDNFYGLSDAQEQQLAIVLGWLDVKGETFSLRVETEVLGKKAFEYDIIINTEKIVRWKEG